MPTIEERAEKYAKDHTPTRIDGKELEFRLYSQLARIIIDAYLAGSAQTQADYVEHYKDKL